MRFKLRTVAVGFYFSEIDIKKLSGLVFCDQRLPNGYENRSFLNLSLLTHTHPDGYMVTKSCQMTIQMGWSYWRLPQSYPTAAFAAGLDPDSLMLTFI